MLDKLRGLVGAPHVLGGVECSPYVLEGRTPEAVVFPGCKEEICAILALAGEEGIPVTPWGGGTKLGIGLPPSRVGLVLGLRRLDRILEHEPGDLTATVEAGITLGALQARLGKRGQWLSLDPACPDRATVGGILASDASGPRRHLYGTARDLLIGLTVVSAEGAIVRGGGKVVKNVAGYDLPKLYIGSFGTLGVLVEATIRLRPRPDEDRLVVPLTQAVITRGDQAFGRYLFQFIAGQLLADELVVGLVFVQRADDVIAITPDIGFGAVALETVAFGIPYQVEPVAGPVLAVMGRGEEPINHFLVSVRRTVCEESIDLPRRRRQPDQVIVDAPQQDTFLGWRRRLQAGRLQLRQYENIDRVPDPARRLDGGKRGEAREGRFRFLRQPGFGSAPGEQSE